MDGSSPPPRSLEDAPAKPRGTLACPECGYDLQGIESDRCPECGLAIDRARLGRSRIPWVHRRWIGTPRAYWRTVWRATFHSGTLAAEAEGPVDYREAQRFRFVTAVLAALVPACAITVAVVNVRSSAAFQAMPFQGYDNLTPAKPPSGEYDLLLPWAAGALILPVMPLAVLLLMLMWAGVPSYWFHPRRIPVVRQNRAVALSCYACAPMAFLPVPALAGCAAALISSRGLNAAGLMVTRGLNVDPTWHRIFVMLVLVAYVTLPLIVLAQYVATLRLLRRAAEAGAARMWLAAAGVPLTWALSAALALFGFPWVVGYVWLVIDSFR